MVTVRLFGRLEITRDRQALYEIPGGKTQELLCYLLLYRRQIHARETLAALLWPDCEASKSKKYLRQVLWQLQLALGACVPDPELHPLSADAESVRLDWSGPLEMDVEIFERAHEKTGGAETRAIDAAQAKALDSAVQLYRGELLEGSYQDWCLHERGRLQNCYLAMLTKLTRYCRDCGDYQRGIEYGERILRLDPAHERSHQQLMTLYFQSGDRTAALRQYERCKAALHQELGVEPSRQTREMYQRMRSDPGEAAAAPFPLPEPHDAPDAVQHLHRLLEFVTHVEAQIKREIRLAEQSIPDLTRRLLSSVQR